MDFTRRSLLAGSAAAAVSVVALSRPTARLFGLEEGNDSARPVAQSVTNARDFGARGDGRADDRTAIQAAIDRVARSGGGTVLLPAGTYIVSRAGESAVAISLRSGVVLEGEGKATVVILQAGSGGHVFNVHREQDCGIRNMVIDGNRTEQRSTGHAIRSGGVRRFRLENLVVMNAFHYGIGLQGGTNRDVTIENVVIQDCGGDGIDIKNGNSANSAISITNVTVLRWGLRPDRETQAAIDCRGPVRLSNIRIGEPGADDSVGVRMRHGELRDPNGLGAHGSTMSSFDIQMGGGKRQIGMAVAARQVAIGDGSVSGGFRGLIVQATDFKGSSITVSQCSDSGILIDSGDSRFAGDRAVLSSCSVTRCGGNGIEVEAGSAQIVGCKSSGNGANGLRITQTASSTRVVGGDYSGNRGGPISDAGANSQVAVQAS